MVASAVGYSASDSLAPGIKQGAEDAELCKQMDFARDVNRALDGDVFEFVNDALRSAYHERTYEQMRWQSRISTRLSPIQRGVAKADKSWAGGEGGEGGEYSLEDVDEAADMLFREHLKRANIDPAIKECSRRCWVQKGFIACPMVVGDRNGTVPRKFITRLFTPDRYHAIPFPGSPGHLMCLQLYSHDVNEHYCYQRQDWTAQTWTLWGRKGNEGAWTFLKSEPNIFGVIPVAMARPNPFNLYHDNFGPALFESTIVINAAQTVQTAHMHTQIKVLAGEFGAITSGQVLQQAGALDLGAGSQVQEIDFQTDQGKFRDVNINGEWQMAAELLGFPADEFDGTQVPQSGEALKIRLYTAMQNAVARQSWLAQFGVDLYWMGLIVLEAEMRLYPAPVEGYLDRKIPPYTPGLPIEQQPVRFCIKPKPITIPMMASETAEIEDRDLAKGYRSIDDIMASKNPGMTKEEAREKRMANLADNNGTATAEQPDPPGEAQDTEETQDTTDPQEPMDTKATDTTEVDASGKVAAGTAAAVTLNGAQITSALEVVTLFGKGVIARVVAVELLVAVGIDRVQANQMADAQEKVQVPEVPQVPNQFTPTTGATK